MMETVRRFLLGASQLNWALADQAIVSAANFATNIVVARTLGLEAFGRFSFMWITIQLLNGTLNALVAIPMMSIGPKQPENGAPLYYGTVFFQQAVIGGICFLLTWGGAIVSNALMPEWRVTELALPLAAASAGYLLQDFLRRYFFSRHRPDAAFVNDCVRYLGQVMVLSLLIRFGVPTVAEVLWVIAVTSAAAVSTGTLSIEDVNGRWDRRNQIEVMTRHWRFSKWLVCSSVLQWGSNNLYLIAAGAYLGASAAGGLRAAANLIAVTNVAFLALSNIVSVIAAKEFSKGGKSALLAELYRTTLLSGTGVLVVCILIGLTPEFWLRMAFGETFSGYGNIVRWFAFIQPIILLEVLLTAVLRAIEFTTPLLFEVLIANLVTAMLIYPLMTRFGVIGVMVELSITWPIQLLILALALRLRLQRIA
jgi:O-antigen/teichoic acid export membrane protein